MPGKDGNRIILAHCAWEKHDRCPGKHPEDAKVSCDCKCHMVAAAK